MGKWHRPYQTAIIIKKIQQDIDPRELYDYEFSLGWTEASEFTYYWKNLKKRVLRLTGRDIYSFINSSTINHISFLNERKKYLSNMAKKKSNTISKEERRKLLEQLDKEDLIIINEAYEKRIKDLENEIAEQKKIKSKCITVFEIENNYKNYNKKFNKTLICKIVGVSRRTVNDKLKKNNLFVTRKVRKDAISHSPLVCALVWDSYQKSTGTYGQRRVHQDIINKGYKYSLSVISSTMRRCCLYVNEISVKKSKYEIKNTLYKTDYLVSKDKLANYKPGEVFSIDFSQIDTSNGKMWIHGARDIITGKIEFLELCLDQKIETVLKHYKKLPNTTKIINTDHGSSYLSYDVQKYLLERNIKQSLGNVGCSYDNRWIEDFWKRIKYEWFTVYPTNNISLLEVSNNIERYVDFFNNKRLSKYSGKWDIPIKIENSYKINSGQFI